MSNENTILYVEDEEDIRQIGEIALQLGDYQVVSCATGFDALEKAAQIKPDLIILDVMMPGMDGLSTLKALRKNQSTLKTPVIFMTAKVQPKEVEVYKNIGAIGIISKPFDPMNLINEVEKIWNLH